MLADLAVRMGFLTRKQLTVALDTRSAADPNVPLDVMLVSLGFLEEVQAEELLKAVGRAAPEKKKSPVPPPRRRPPAAFKPHSSPDDSVARIVGAATLIEPIGRGPSGRVYRAFHGELECEVVVKEIPANPLNEPFLEKFSKRARLLCDLEHPNVARVLEIVDRPESLFIVSEMVEGVTLLEHLRQNQVLEPAQAIPILRQIGMGLQAAHRAGAVHGNLKAENVLLTEGMGVKLTDFGLGRDDPEFLKTHADLAGTILHVLAPEQWSREAVPASDLYACGVLWHFMLTGQFPFTGKGYGVTRQNHEQGTARPPSECRDDLPSGADVLFWSLANKDAKARYPTLRAFLSDLRCLEVGFPLKGPKPAKDRPDEDEDPPLRRRASGGGRPTSG
jgi:serine/threonine protein kinase